MKILLSLITVLSGCSALRTIEPNTLPVEFTHVSHVSQHFGPNPTNYGYDAFSIGAKWLPIKNLSLSVSEGVILEPGHCAANGALEHGALDGPREVFTGRVAYEIPVK